MKNIIIEERPKIEKSWREVLDSLKVGESFLVDITKRNSITNIASVHFHSHNTKEFRTTSKGQPQGRVRIWRVR